MQDLQSRASLSAGEMRAQVNAIQQLMDAVMRDGEHYGRIPGSRRPSLWKPGAEKLCVAFHIQPSFVVEDLSTPGHYRYRVKCIGTHQQSGIKLGEGMGSCSSLEQKFSWRRASDLEWDNTPPKHRRLKYRFDREKLKPIEVKQVRADQEDLENTILKMACKRAHVAMTLNVTAASDIFTQDIEDLPEHPQNEGEEGTPLRLTQIKMPRRKAKTAKKRRSRPSAPEQGTQTEGVVHSLDAKRQERSGALSADRVELLKATMLEKKVTEEAVVKKFGVSLGALPAARFNEVAAWLIGMEERP